MDTWEGYLTVTDYRENFTKEYIFQNLHDISMYRLFK